MIVANGIISHKFDIRIADNIPYTIRNEQLFFIKEGFEHDLAQAILYNPKRIAIAYSTNKYTSLKINDNIEIRNKDNFDFPNYVDFRHPEYEAQNQEYIIKAKEIKSGLAKIYGSKKPLPQVGMNMISKGRFGKERIVNAFYINKSSNVKLHNITIYCAGGMGILGERSSCIIIDSANVIDNPDKQLMVRTTADYSFCWMQR